jgi:hypothetical protein
MRRPADMDRFIPSGPSTGIENGGTAFAGEPGGVTIEVALATRDSARYLPELLDSLFAQTDQTFTLLVADDGSSDTTPELIALYQRRFPGRIRTLTSGKGDEGALAIFSRLIDNLTADYVLFCDHDDVWLPNKIATSLAAIRAFEGRNGRSMPLLVHTDLTVVGQDLEPLGASSFRYQGIDSTRNDLGALLVVNTVSGCAAIANRALYERARPLPPQAIMHDHWLAIVAASLGAILCLEESTILYRQHGGNAIGATRWGLVSVAHRIRQTLFEDTKRRLLRRFSGQAAALLAHCGADMTPAHYRTTAALAGLWSVSPWRRAGLLWRNGLMLNGFIRNSALFVAVTLAPRRGRSRAGTIVAGQPPSSSGSSTSISTAR